MLTDLTEDQLWEYRSTQAEPSDFDAFWAGRMAEARTHELDVTVAPVASGLHTIDIFDLSFAGSDGTRVSAWLRVPRNSAAPLPVVLQFPGYGSGRGHAMRDLLWSAAGYAHLSVDVRGQGETGRTTGFMTEGIESEHTYYYTRVFADAARAVDAARSLEQVDATRVALVGASQGGGIALAAAALATDVTALVVQAPFLSDLRRASQITNADPYGEIGRFLAGRRDLTDRAHRTLAYADAVLLARRSTVPALFSTGLMDDITPPSTVFGAYHSYAGPKRMVTWPYNGHEAGGPLDDELALAFVADKFSTTPNHRHTQAGQSMADDPTYTKRNT